MPIVNNPKNALYSRNTFYCAIVLKNSHAASGFFVHIAFLNIIVQKLLTLIFQRDKMYIGSKTSLQVNRV